eukprot:TRINITY_DN76135_c0_g1_i1.p1 TRINITY_DN76135_c0_g1~~TRINITY_DN76135_c0_g1_i1.p1  ORF type:complete len:320 (-),score=49.34 TRINITY_DN76135_c0_g1_i1:79-1038(-)
MNCVERLQAFSELEPEEQPGKEEPPNGWPAQGAIEYDGVCMKYRPTTPEILHSLEMKIEGGKKVGIVGRTGSGKSSLLLSLFRIPTDDCQSGTIFIDGVNTATIPRKSLRSRIAIIPQDPVLFQGTMRSNLDPLDEFTDDQIWEALKLSHLKDEVDKADGEQIQGEDKSKKLNMSISEGGSNLSTGQAQLVCLARAVLRKHKVLLMDEATASVDMHTDRLIQQTIRQYFADCTVLTIAHRLHTVLDCDLIIVMADGKLAEFGTPQELLSHSDGVLSGMVRKLRQKKHKKKAGGIPGSGSGPLSPLQTPPVLQIIPEGSE